MVPIVPVAFILGGAYVTGKFLELSGEIYKADAMKESVIEGVNTAWNKYDKAMKNLTNSFGL